MFQHREKYMLGAIAALFITLRLIYIKATFLWVDDMLTLPIINYTPWMDLPGIVFEHAQRITGPFLPSLFDAIIVNIVGPNIIAIRLLSVLVSVLSLLLLNAVIKLLFPESYLARWIPLLLFTFSIPSIIYAQQIQPSIYYLLATITLLYVYIRLFQHAHVDLGNLYFPMFIFVLVASFLFFLNYMILLIIFMLSLLLTLRIYFAARLGQIGWKAGLVQIVYFTVIHLPLLWIAYHVLYNEKTNAARSYFIPFYSNSPLIFLRDTYDFVTYHLNFTYNPSLYQPLGFNLLSLPFFLLFLWGVRVFALRDKLHSLMVIIAIGFLIFLKTIQIFPYAGTRHTFTIAPILYLFVGYALWQLERSQRMKNFISFGFVVLVLGIWCVSGWHLYEMRRSRLNLQSLITLTQEYDIQHILAFASTYRIITVKDYTDGHPLTIAHLTINSMGRLDDLADIKFDEPFLLVAINNAINPDWENPFGVNPAGIVASKGNYKVTALIEDHGLLPTDLSIAQSIYWPVNGFFVYLIEPINN